MGSTAHVVVLGPRAAALVLRCRARLAELEARWSRFRDDSEVSVLNRSAGTDVIVSHDTALLVQRALDGWRVTDGAFDPTVLGAMLRAGYDRDFRLLRDHDGRDPSIRNETSLALGADGIEVDLGTRRVYLPAGVGLDPGGIGKGLAADIVAAELLVEGAEGVCVNVGGDVRVVGGAPDGAGWRVELEDPESDMRFARVVLADGAVATSSPLRRRWRGTRGEMHHLVDPRTGDVADTDARSVTVVAAEAWQAEVLAKAAILGNLACVERTGAAALRRRHGHDEATAKWHRFAEPLGTAPAVRR
jgi:thiamine biosynthesis lipoprotein